MVIGVLIAAVPIGAVPPAWWSQGNPPVLSSAESSNKGIANVGQGKWMAQSALEGLRAALGADSPVVTAIESELYKATETSQEGVFFPERPASPSAAWLEAQRAPLQIGALKALAAPFYKHLTQFDAAWVEGQLQANGLTMEGAEPENTNGNYFEDTDGTLYPWNPADNQDQEKNRASANIGQLKLVFSLRFESFDFDSDGMPDAWEIEYFGGTDVADAQGDWDGDGLTNLAEFNAGLDPTDADRDGDGISDGSDPDPFQTESASSTASVLRVWTHLEP